MREMIIVDGRRMAKYWLVETVGQDEKIRRLVPKKLRNVVFDLYGHRCAICAGRFTARELQLDHRIPFRVGGDPADPTVDDYMPLCGSDNRAKSWSCEQCPNWVDREVGMCETCYWANPDSYEHIAGEQERRLIVAVRGKGVERFDRLQEIAASEGKTPGAWILENFHKFIH